MKAPSTTGSSQPSPARSPDPPLTPPELLTLDACPACGGQSSRLLFPPGVCDNDVEDALVRYADRGLRPADMRVYRRSDFAACDSCGLIWARKRLSVSSAALDYVRLLEAIEGRSPAGASLAPATAEQKQATAARMVDYLQGTVAIRPDHAILSLRAGSGHLLHELRARHGVEEVYGLEFFEKSRRYAIQTLGLSNFAPMAVPEFEIPFARRHYDVVFANHLLTHAHDPTLLLNKLSGCLAPGGVIVVYNELDHEVRLRREQAYRRGINVFHKQLLSAATLIRLVTRHGLAIRMLPRITLIASPDDAWLSALIWRPGERAGEVADRAPPMDPRHITRAFDTWHAARERRAADQPRRSWRKPFVSLFSRRPRAR